MFALRRPEALCGDELGILILFFMAVITEISRTSATERSELAAELALVDDV